MKVKVTIWLDVDQATYAQSAGIPTTEVREHVKQGAIDAYLGGCETDDPRPDGITGWSWS